MANRKQLGVIAFFGLLAVALGAFGAHGLKPMMDAQGIDLFITANRYHFYHTFLALFAWSSLSHIADNQRFIIISLSLTGIVLFSGSLYLLAIRHLLGNPGWLGPITPLGGFCFLMAWFLLIYFSLKHKN
jgi:uncharacterized membrane protein YgdD (TMEM256/DUF423 family)